MKTPKSLTDAPVTRRAVIASATLVPLAALTSAPLPAAPQAAAPAAASAFSRDQRRILEAFVDRLVPKDESGPGAVECGVIEYIDGSLADFMPKEKPALLQGLTALNAYATRTQGAAFADLTPEKKDAVLTAVDTNQATPELKRFFDRVRRLTLEGMFCDPSYGGNKNFAGWDLIRYPGAKMTVGPEDQRMKTPPKPYRQALYKAGERRSGDKHGH
ncbi:MAG: gluconate 2-dehydrogenase subunit 3 family protein [Bryobacterales bacterium]|nr:gluconate 2-dehydrogenase subunit 3 family protein [Bryobacterales bacterium]